VEDPKMKVAEAQLRESQQDSKKITKLSPVETYDIHFGIKAVIPRSGENDRPSEDPSTIPRTNEGRINEDNR
jgi:hypothetical protein